MININKNSFDDILEFVNNNNDLNRIKKKKKKKFIIILANVLSIVLLVAGGFGLKILYDNSKAYDDIDNMMNELSSLYNYQTEETNEPTNNNPENTPTNNTSSNYDNYSNKSFEELLNINNDTVGWLGVNNTNVNFPIVQSTNNDYYLNHDFKKQYNYLGWAFADYRNNFSNDLSKNTIIYGHTIHNANTVMFSTLKKVLTDSWLNNPDNYTLTFNTINKNMQWQIFSIYTIPVTDDYLRVNFNDDNDFLNFVNKLKNRSIRNFNVEILPSDAIITLSTCYLNSNNRLVVHAKLIQ